MKARAAPIHTVFLSSAAFLFLLALPVCGQILLVANPFSGTVSRLDSFSRTVTKTYTVPGLPGPDPVGVAINPTETLAAVYNNDSPIHRVDFYDLTSAATTPSGTSVTLTGGFFGPGAEIAFTSDGACVVASHGPGPGEVSSINVATRTQVTVGATGGRGVGTVPGHPHLAIAVSGSVLGGFFYVLTVAADCGATSGPPIALGPSPSVPNGVVAFPNGQGALVPDDAGFVHVLSISSGGAVTWVKKISIGDSAESIAITPDGHHAYVFKGGVGKLRLLFIDSFNNVTDSGLQVDVPPDAFLGSGVTADLVATDGTTVFVSGGTFGTTITMVDAPSFTNIGTVTVGTGPLGLAYGGCPHHRVHGHIDTVPLDGHNGVVAGVHHGQHGHLVAPGSTCPPHAPGHSPGLTAETTGEGLFSTGGAMEAPDFVAGLNQDGTLNGNPGAAGAKVLPARRGTVVQLFGSAAGLFLDEQHLRAASGFTAPASGSPLFYTTSLPEVRIGGAAAQVLFSGLAPGLTGVWQINVLIPNAASVGSVPVTINYEGDELTSVSLAIE